MKEYKEVEDVRLESINWRECGVLGHIEGLRFVWNNGIATPWYGAQRDEKHKVYETKVISKT